LFGYSVPRSGTVSRPVGFARIRKKTKYGGRKMLVLRGQCSGPRYA
ncbi:hypothetical protein L915_04087, partial [Phytophthora nicotianae]